MGHKYMNTVKTARVSSLQGQQVIFFDSSIITGGNTLEYISPHMDTGWIKNVTLRNHKYFEAF